MSPPPPHLMLLGTLSFDGKDGRVEDRKPLLVLAALALQPDRRMHRDDLARRIWSDKSEDNARLSLRQARYLIGRWCSERCVVVEGDYLSLGPSVTVDLWALETALDEGDTEAVGALYRGPLLDTYTRRIEGDFARHVSARAARLRTRVVAAFREEIARRLEVGRGAGAKELAQRLVKMEPRDEDAQATVIDALDAAGDATAAIAAYEAYRALVGGEVTPALASRVEAMKSGLRPVVGPGAPAGSPPKATAWRDASRFLAGAIFSAAVAWALWPRPPAWPTGAELTIPVTREDVGSVDLVLSDEGHRWSDPYRLPADYVRRGGGVRAAGTLSAEGGYDLWVDLGDGEEVVLRDAPPDEKPLDWSPDEDRLLYRSGRSEDGGRGYTVEVRWADLAAPADSDDRLVRRFVGNPGIGAAWSPDGLTIAMRVVATEASDTLLLLEPNGDVIASRVVEGGSRPAWSPSSRWVAYVETGPARDRLVMTDRRGSRGEVLVELDASIRTPVWLTDQILLFVADYGTGGDVWSVDRRRGGIRPVTRDARVRAIRPGGIDPTRFVWLDDVPPELWCADEMSAAELGRHVERLDLTPVGVVGVGEYFDVGARAVMSDGRNSLVRPTAMTWTAEGGLEPVAPGLFRAVSAGPAVVRATLRSWREAELELTVAPPSAAGAPVVFHEPWDDPSQLESAWIRFGTPRPHFDPVRGVFASNGDQNHSSGAVSIESFDTSRGLTLEVEGSVPLNGGLYQVFTFGLLDTPPGSDGPDEWERAFDVRVHVGARSLFLTRSGVGRSIDLPLPPVLADWRRYAMQIEPDGEVSLWLDGTPYHRVSWGPVPGRVHVLVGGASVGTDILHGDVIVRSGLRYRVPTS